MYTVLFSLSSSTDFTVRATTLMSALCEAKAGGSQEHVALSYRQAITDVCLGDCPDSFWMWEMLGFLLKAHGAAACHSWEPRQVAALISTRARFQRLALLRRC